ncbi:hypothetical protein [Mycobacterium kyorinense]|uniref:hypothetical protein n=1 Tax=Mycobacterium kyorinense TaxID=487514 RepID=UPI000ABC2BE4|nr:hypothetical protein [Mycobacterium kyorinense]
MSSSDAKLEGIVDPPTGCPPPLKIDGIVDPITAAVLAETASWRETARQMRLDRAADVEASAIERARTRLS